MIRSLLFLALIVAVAGCQPKPEEPKAVSQNKQVETANKLLAQGILFLQQKNIKGAIESLEDSIRMNPSDPNAYLILGQILLNAQQFSKAVEFLDQTAKNFPNNGAVFYMLSIANRMDGKILPAVLAAKRSYELNKADGNEEMAKNTAMLLEELIKEGQAMQNKQQADSAQDKTMKTKEMNTKK